MQYRMDFVLDGVVEIFWMAAAIVPLLVVFHGRPSIAGWSFGEALMVMGWFTFLEGVLEGAINPSLASVVEHIRKGTLDFVLLKPADAQFLVSTARFHLSLIHILSATRFWGGAVVGVAVGFRHLYVALELDASYASVTGNYNATQVQVSGITLAPASALWWRFLSLIHI